MIIITYKRVMIAKQNILRLLKAVKQNGKACIIAILFCLAGVSNITAQNYATNDFYSNTVITSQMKWVSGGYRFTLDIPLNSNTYRYYKAQSKRNSYPSYVQEHAGYEYMDQIVRKLKVDADDLGYSGWKLAEYLTAFVQQNITYTKDPYNNGFDYPKFPMETLVEKKGDCEDAAILLASLLKRFGFGVVLITLPGHMAVGITCKNCNTFYNFEGKKYGYIETTSPNWKIGDIPPNYKKATATFLKLPNLNVKTQLQKKVPKNTDCTCDTKKQVKIITIEGIRYTIKPNETIEVKQNGLTVRVSN